MSLKINTPERHWTEAATLAHKMKPQGTIPVGKKDAAVQVIGKYKYILWESKTGIVNVELAE